MKKCEHELKTLSEPVVDMDITLLGGNCFFCPPIFQCIKCKKIFRTGYNEETLYEIPIKTIEELEKEYDEQKPIKRRASGFTIFMILMIAVSMVAIIIMLLLMV